MTVNTFQTERLLYHGRDAEYAVFDALPKEVRDVFNYALTNWSAKDAYDHWKNPLHLLDLPYGKTVHEQVIDDVKWADEQEAKKGRAMLARRVKR